MSFIEDSISSPAESESSMKDMLVLLYFRGLGVWAANSGFLQEGCDPGDAFFQLFDRLRVGEAHVPLRRVGAEIHSRGDRDARLFQQVAGEGVAVLCQLPAARIDVERALRHHRDVEPEPAQ